MNRPLIVGIAGAIIVAAAIVLTFFIDREPDRPVQQASPGAPTSGSARDPAAPPMPSRPSLSPAERADGKPGAVAPAPAGQTGRIDLPATATHTPDGPSFDVVRVSPQGDTVIAGRAAPNAEVELRIGNDVIGTARADKRGEWVLVPQKPIPPGTHELRVVTRLPDGRTVVGGSVVVIVPERGKDIAGQPSDKPAGSLAVALPAQKGDVPVVLQTPGGMNAGTLSLNAIDYGTQGTDLTMSGRAPPGAEVRVYIDNGLIGTTTADDKGVWRLRPDTDVPAGLHKLRVDQTGAGGKVVARVELPFSRASPLRDFAGDAVVFVQPGNSLWRLARSRFGEGLRFTEIYEANRDQIRNPDLIYPGQVFVLPKS